MDKYDYIQIKNCIHQKIPERQILKLTNTTKRIIIKNI